MAKKSPKHVGAHVPAPESHVTESTVAESVKAVSPIGVKGPRGVPADAAISNIVANPKRVGSAAWARFEAYAEGMTVTAALAAGLTTADLMYDAAHKYIYIDGYEPKELAPKKERAPKAEKPAKAKKVKAEPTEAQLELAAATEEEMID